MTDFLYDAGTNGFIKTPLNLLSTELNAIANAHTALSSVGGSGSAGIFSQTDTGGANFAGIFFQSGGSFTAAAGDAIYGYFLESDDGTHFDKTVSNAMLARGPDFVIPLFGAAYASGDRAWCNGRYVQIPESNFQVLIYSGTATLPSSGNLIKMAPFADTLR